MIQRNHPILVSRPGLELINKQKTCRLVDFAHHMSFAQSTGAVEYTVYLYKGVRLRQQVFCGPVGCGCRIHLLLLCRGLRYAPPNTYPESHTKQSDGEVPVMLEFGRMWSSPSLPLLPGPLLSGVVAPDRVLTIG